MNGRTLTANPRRAHEQWADTALRREVVAGLRKLREQLQVPSVEEVRELKSAAAPRLALPAPGESKA